MEVHVSLVGRRDLSGAIYRQLRRAILDGHLRPGDPLPATRELARRLSVSRTSVTVAYDRLWGEGFVTARVGAGTFVSDQAATGRQAPSRARAEGPLLRRGTAQQHQGVLAAVAGDGTELVQELPLVPLAGVGVARRQGPRQVDPTGLLHSAIVTRFGRILFEANLPARVGKILRHLGT